MRRVGGVSANVNGGLGRGWGWGVFLTVCRRFWEIMVL
jgi:hypothetical protein